MCRHIIRAGATILYQWRNVVSKDTELSGTFRSSFAFIEVIVMQIQCLKGVTGTMYAFTICNQITNYLLRLFLVVFYWLETLLHRYNNTDSRVLEYCNILQNIYNAHTPWANSYSRTHIIRAQCYLELRMYFWLRLRYQWRQY